MTPGVAASEVATDAAPAAQGPERRAARRWAARGAPVVWALALVLLMTRRSLHDLCTTLPLNLGDPALNTWILSWESHALVHDPAAWFTGNVFHPSGSALGYSELMLPMVPAFALVWWVSGNAVLAHNLVIVVLLVFGMLSTRALARHLGIHGVAAWCSAVAFTFSAYTYAHLGHVQLLSFGFFPLAALAVLRMVAKRRVRDGVLVGVATAALLTACLYYGAIWLLCLTTMVGADIAVNLRRRAVGWQRSTIAAVVATAVLLAPVVGLFTWFQSRNQFVRPLSAEGGLNPSDLLAPAPGSYAYREAAVASLSRPEALEHTFFLGLVALAAAAVGVVTLVRRRSRPAAALTTAADELAVPPWRSWWLVILAGVVAVLVSLGPTFAGLPAPFRLLFHVAPGFDSIRVAARLAVPGMLVVALLAGLGVGSLRGRTNLPWVPMVTCGLIALELAAPFPRVDARPSASVAELHARVAELPAGAIAQLPIAGAAAGVAGVFTESPRMLWSIGDWRPRFNGTSGGTPAEYFGRVDVLNTFPSPESLALLRELRIRYVALDVAPGGGPFAYSREAAAAIAATGVGPVVVDVDAGVVLDLGAR